MEGEPPIDFKRHGLSGEAVDRIEKSERQRVDKDGLAARAGESLILNEGEVVARGTDSEEVSRRHRSLGEGVLVQIPRPGVFIAQQDG